MNPSGVAPALMAARSLLYAPERPTTCSTRLIFMLNRPLVFDPDLVPERFILGQEQIVQMSRRGVVFAHLVDTQRRQIPRQYRLHLVIIHGALLLHRAVLPLFKQSVDL